MPPPNNEGHAWPPHTRFRRQKASLWPNCYIRHHWPSVLAAIAFTAILLAIGRGNAYESGGWGAALILFAVLFLTSWAGGIWLHPMGPELFGAPWMPFVLTAFVVTMLVAAITLHYAYYDERNAGPVAGRQAEEALR
ncbi:MAG TPA: hypothetical protein VF278_18205 [Pirellulales bacterium]